MTAPMTSKTFKRARDAAAKNERRRAILDAALSLFQAGDLLPRVDDIAQQAGLAKGTVYLYFDSREEIYLCLVEEHFKQQLDALEALLRAGSPLSPNELADWVLLYQQHHPAFLPMACIVSTVLEQNVGSAVALNFKQMLAEKLVVCGGLLEQVVKGLPEGEGTHLLLGLYCMLIGLWQTAHPPRALKGLIELMELKALMFDFTVEASHSLRALCRGYCAG